MLEQVRDGQIEVGFVHKGLDEFMQKIDVAMNRLIIAFVVAAGLIGSSLIGVFATSGPQVLGLNVVSRSASSSRGCSASGSCGESSAQAGSVATALSAGCRFFGTVSAERTSGAAGPRR